ncbi:MAG: hypothetical protein ACE5JR_01190 [Gemmatimonadota bacterium]
MGFCAEQLERLRPLWDFMLAHPFLRETRDGTLPPEKFATWMRQDYLFVEAAIPFTAALIPRAPARHREPLTNALAALHQELRLFEERASALGVELKGTPPSFICHAYVQFLIATAYAASYAEAYTVYYVAEKAYHDSWRVVKEGIDPSSSWYPFVEKWGGESFREYVMYLEGELDTLAGEVGPAARARMADLFEVTTKYEVAFWELAMQGESWPGLESFPGLAAAGVRPVPTRG